MCICCLLLAFLPECSIAQTQGKAKIDSLLKDLAKQPEDTNKVNLLVAVSNNYTLLNPDDGLKYGKQALSLAELLKWKKGINNAYICIGSNYDNKSDPPSALEYFFKAMKICEELHDQKSNADVLGDIGLVYNEIGDRQKALAYYLKALKIHTALNNKVGMQSCLGNIGIVYGEQGDYRRALEYFNKSLKINEELNNNEGVSKNLVSIGIVSGMNGKNADALAYFFRALRIEGETGSKNSLALHYGNIGGAYLSIARDTAHDIVQDSLIPANRQAVLRKAIEYLNKAITIAKEIGYLDAVIECSNNIAEAYNLEGDYKKAFGFYKQYSITKDSVYSAANKIAITNLETKREMDLKDKQIEINKLAVEKKRNERGLFTAGIILLLLVIVFIFRNYEVQKKSNILLSKEKKRSEDLLLNILPTEVADELKEKGSAEAKHFDNVTVLFTDFVNFTQAGERMGPGQLIDELDTCFKAFDEIMDHYNVEKIKTIGDAYLAVCGLPVSDPRHAENIVRAAIHVRNYMTDRHTLLGDKTFEIRIGIHSGNVVAGIVGIKKFAYDIWGDTVNTAARMEQNSEPGKVNISETTYELVKDKFTCQYRGEIEAKNKGVMKMYFVS